LLRLQWPVVQNHRERNLKSDTDRVDCFWDGAAGYLSSVRDPYTGKGGDVQGGVKGGKETKKHNKMRKPREALTSSVCLREIKKGGELTWREQDGGFEVRRKKVFTERLMRPSWRK